MDKEELKEMHEKTEKKELIKKIIISFLCAVLGTTITLFAMYKSGNTTNYMVHRVVFLFLAFWFAVLHVTFPLGEMYEFITKHRYKLALIVLIFMTLMQYTNSSNNAYSIFTMEEDKNNSILRSTGVGYLYQDYAVEEPLAASQAHNGYNKINTMVGGVNTDLLTLVHSPVKNIFIIAKLYNVGYLLLGPHMGLAFESTFKVLFILLASYEFLMILTNNKKLYAVIGAFTLATSIAVQADAMLIIACVETILVLFNKFMLEEKYKVKVLCVLGMTISLLTFLFTFYIPYIVPFGYFMIAGIIWIILKNKKEYKFKLADLLLIVCGLVITVIFVVSFFYTSQEAINFLRNTVYPGQGNNTRMNGITFLFTYLYNYLMPFKPQINGLYFGGIISLIPITFLLAFYYAFYKDSHQEFFMPMVVFTTFIVIATVSGFPAIVNKFTLFSYVYQYNSAVVADFVGFLIMFYYLANVQEPIFKTKGRIRFLILIMIPLAFIQYPRYILDHRLHLSVFATIICWCGYSLLSANKKEYRGALLFSLVVLSITGLFYKPVTIGMHAITDLDISHKITELSENDKDAKWVALSDLPLGMANFIAANGGTSINATPLYQGEDFYKNLLGEEKANETKDIWNRYALLKVELSNENNVELINGADDQIMLKLNKESFEKLGVKYIVTYMEQNEIEKEGYKVTKLFETPNNYESSIDGFAPKGIYIYELSTK